MPTPLIETTIRTVAELSALLAKCRPSDRIAIVYDGLQITRNEGETEIAYAEIDYDERDRDPR